MAQENLTPEQWKELWDSWKLNPVTQQLLRYLNSEIQAKTFQWRQGQFDHMTQFATSIQNARAIGNCEMAQIVIDLELEQLQGIENE